MMTFRENHNMRMSRNFLIGLFVHIPVFAFVASKFEQSILPIIGLSLFILAAPTVAYLMRVKSALLPNLLAFSAMCFSGILIHAGRGMIELHFHIFIVLATMITFGLLSPVITAVLTIAIHHLAFFYFYPKSVFNYEATLGIVLLHATFVILEAIPVLMIAARFKHFINLQDSTVTQLTDISSKSLTLVSLMGETGQDLKATAESGSDGLNITQKGLDEISTNVQRNRESSSQSRELVLSSKDLVDKGLKETRNLLDALHVLSGSSDKIRDIVSIIDDIAFQTNLLALNAAVEAARAGEQGRGFGVVAEAVRNLALKSAASAKDIGHLLGENIEKIELSEKLAESSHSILNGVHSSIEEVSTYSNEIAQASDNQSQGVNEVLMQIKGLSETMRLINAASSQLFESSVTMSEDNETLKTLVDSLSEKEKHRKSA